MDINNRPRIFQYTTKYIVLMVLALTALFMMLVWVLIHNFSERILNAETTKIFQYANQVSAVIQLNRKLADIYFTESIASNQKILDTMTRANFTEGEMRDVYREELAAMIQPTYQNAIRQDFRQFHFHLVNSDSFYRAHQPEKFGDSLLNVRATIEKTNTDRIFVEGFEEGRIFNGYRYVYPLFNEGQHIGSVELSVSMAAFTNAVNESFLSNGIFIIRQDISDEKVFDEFLDQVYFESEVFPGYYIDREVFEQNHEVFLDEYPVGAFDEFLPKGENFIYVDRGNPLYRNFVFLSVANFEGEDVGYLVFSDKNEDILNLINDKNLFSFLLINFWLATSLVLIIVLRSRKQIYDLSLIDFLTGVDNYEGFTIQGKALFENAKRLGAFWLCFIDIDNFKSINDTHGHGVGDQVLIDFANILKESFRSADVIGRFGGDEFVVCGIQKEKDCGKVFFDRIREKMRAYNEENPNDLTMPLRFSVGYSFVDDFEAITFEHMLRDADQKMYEMKAERKD